MSVPFKYRQQVRDLFASFGGKPLAAADLEFIQQRLPTNGKFSTAVLEKYTALCPLDEAGFLNLIGEGQKECGVPYDDLTWGLIEGIAYHHFFHGEGGSEASCDTKELRAALDPKIRPVRLDVNALFAKCTSGGEQITLSEVMQVFRNVYPANQTNFNELFLWAKATKPAARKVPPPKASQPSGAEPLEAATPSSPQTVTTGETQPSPAPAAPSSPVPPPPAQEQPASPVAVPPPPPPPQPQHASPSEGGSFSLLRDKFGATKSSSKAAERESSPPEGPASPAPPPPPPPEADSDDEETAPLDGSVTDGAASAFAAYFEQKEREAAINAPPAVVVTAAAAADVPQQRRKSQGDSLPNQKQQDSDDGHPQQHAPSASQGGAAAASGANNVSSQGGPLFVLREPPPLPPHIKAAVAQLSNTNKYQPSPSSGTYASGSAGGGSVVFQGSAPLPTYRETLSLRQVQQLPPEVIEFIHQLDEQRSHLQTQLERELDELTENGQTLRLLKDRLASLQLLQQTPVFAPLEAERTDLIQRMEQWMYATRSNKEATRHELSRLKHQKLADAAAESLYRDPTFSNMQPPATTAIGGAVASPSRLAASAALTAFSDPTPRLARFFENLSTKEREVKMQEAALDRLRHLEKREQRLLRELADTEHQRSLKPNDDVQRPAGVVFSGGPSTVERSTLRQTAVYRPESQLQPRSDIAGVGPQTSRVFRMDTGGNSTATAGAAPAKAATVVPTQLFFSPKVNNPRHQGTLSPAATSAISGANPYLAKNLQQEQDFSYNVSASVTQRLEEYMSGRRR